MAGVQAMSLYVRPSIPSLCSGHAQAVFSLHGLNMLEAIISPLP